MSSLSQFEAAPFIGVAMANRVPVMPEAGLEQELPVPRTCPNPRRTSGQMQ
jgi:hypothetical protein